MELVAGALYPVRLGLRSRLALETPRARSLRRDGEVQRQVGLEPAAGKLVSHPYHFERHAASVALVGDRRVAEPVADDPRAGLQGGANDVADELCARGEEEEEFAAVAGRVLALVFMTSIPSEARASQRRLTCVDLPQPSPPSKVMNLPRAIARFPCAQAFFGFL